MRLWTKAIIGIAAVLVLGVGANFVATAANTDNPAGVVDISGPCDEAEHANDPRCNGAGVVGDDNSGPGSHGDDDDNSGPGSQGDDDNDRSGHGDEDSGSEDDSGAGDED